ALAQRVHENEVLERAQTLYDAGDVSAAMAVLKAEPPLSAGQLRLAEWSAEQGDARQAVRYYQQVLEQEGTLAANDYRGLARAWLASDQDPQQALDWYAQAMVATELLPRKALQPRRDDVVFTRAMRPDEKDDWLRRGLRADAHELYEQQNPTIHLHNDNWWRSDGTPGLSRLKANTTMLQIEYPIKRGKGFVRADHVRMDAGRLRRDNTGVYRGEFGTCGAGSSGCRSGLKQTATGTSLAAGWQGQRLNFDVGVTPQGFAVTNWTGGLSYTGNIRQLGWRLTASRRPMSNSLLSFAGARDPRT